jgi:hypothetical protein
MVASNCQSADEGDYEPIDNVTTRINNNNRVIKKNFPRLGPDCHDVSGGINVVNVQPEPERTIDFDVFESNGSKESVTLSAATQSSDINSSIYCNFEQLSENWKSPTGDDARQGTGQHETSGVTGDGFDQQTGISADNNSVSKNAPEQRQSPSGLFCCSLPKCKIFVVRVIRYHSRMRPKLRKY